VLKEDTKCDNCALFSFENSHLSSCSDQELKLNVTENFAIGSAFAQSQLQLENIKQI